MALTTASTQTEQLLNIFCWRPRSSEIDGRARHWSPMPYNININGIDAGCTGRTMDECLRRGLFGLPSTYWPLVRKIKEGMPVYLFNYSNGTLHGVWTATTSGGWNIEEDGAYSSHLRLSCLQRDRPISPTSSTMENEIASVLSACSVDEYAHLTRRWTERVPSPGQGAAGTHLLASFQRVPDHHPLR